MEKITAAGLIAEAAAEIEMISVAGCLPLVESPQVVFVDVREAAEVATGMIPGAVHCPRGFLEFQLCAESPVHNPVFATGRDFIFVCATSTRSILATSLARRFGLKAKCMMGGMSAWHEAGGPVSKH
jgi:rhodanese-related sulfurtransferase